MVLPLGTSILGRSVTSLMGGTKSVYERSQYEDDP